jgi:hypothetical protein
MVAPAVDTVTVFVFARKNGLLVWRVAPELTSVETM